MEFGCDLEVDVNGETIFMVNKEILASFSGRFNKMFGGLNSRPRHLKVVFRNFPGGAFGFELFARFCYNNGLIDITPCNLIILSSVAHFMEIGSISLSSINLVNRMEKSIEQINLWTWSEILVALRQCQDLLPAVCPFLLERVLDCLVGRLALPLPSVAGPFCCCSDNSSYQSSSDTSTTCSARINCSPAIWWYEDLVFLNGNMFEKVIRKMVSHKLDHATIFKFLVSYLSSKCLRVSQSMKSKIIDLAFMLLPLLDRKGLSCKGLFDVLRLLSGLNRIKKHHKLKLQELIGSMLDQATLDHLLVPSPRGKRHMYDVCLVLRLVKQFLLEGWMNPTRLKKVACLIESYQMEVAPDVFLRPSKFIALVTVLPDFAGENSDRLYQAIDIYFKVHLQLSNEEKMSICCPLNLEKLSEETLEHLSRNSLFPSSIADKAFISQPSKDSKIDHSHFTRLRTSKYIPFHGKGDEDTNWQGSAERTVFNESKDKDSIDSGNLETRVGELEKNGTIGHSQMSQCIKPSLYNSGTTRSFLPKLCSWKD